MQIIFTLFSNYLIINGIIFDKKKHIFGDVSYIYM